MACLIKVAADGPGKRTRGEGFCSRLSKIHSHKMKIHIGPVLSASRPLLRQKLFSRLPS